MLYYILFSYNKAREKEKCYFRKSLGRENAFTVLYLSRKIARHWTHAVQPMLFEGKLYIVDGVVTEQ